MHGEYKPAADRADPVSFLEEQGKSRLRENIASGRFLGADEGQSNQKFISNKNPI
jgi:hypothetical protein